MRCSPGAPAIDPMTGLPYPPGVFIGGFGPPADYNTGLSLAKTNGAWGFTGPAVTTGKLGGNPDVTAFVNNVKAPPVLRCPTSGAGRTRSSPCRARSRASWSAGRRMTGRPISHSTLMADGPRVCLALPHHRPRGQRDDAAGHRQPAGECTEVVHPGYRLLNRSCNPGAGRASPCASRSRVVCRHW